MITVNGHEFKTIAEPIYVNRKRVSKVLVNGLQVYPAVKRGEKVSKYGMFFGLSSDIVSAYSSEPVNQYGAYAKFANGTDNVYRVAFAITYESDGVHRQLFVSYEGFVRGGGVQYVPYVANSGYIVADGISHSNINVFDASVKSDAGKYYYETSSPRANLTDADGNELMNYSTETTSENVGIFYSADEARAYILT